MYCVDLVLLADCGVTGVSAALPTGSPLVTCDKLLSVDICNSLMPSGVEANGVLVTVIRGVEADMRRLSAANCSFTWVW